MLPHGADPLLLGRPRPPAAGRPRSARELSDAHIGFVRDLIRRETGIELSTQDYLVRQRLSMLARRVGLLDAVHVLELLKRYADPKLRGHVVDAMTTNVTSFFRDPGLFDCLVETVLPELIRFTETEERPLLIWSAACSSGQEAVSVAIVLLERFGAVAFQPGRVRIVASDVSPPMVERTRAGRYTTREMGQGLDDQRIGTWFDQRGDEWITRPVIQRMIEARNLNLLDSYAGLPRCDLVLLRNVLIYFSPDNRRTVLERVRREVLAPEGSLLLGGSESGLFSMSQVGFRADRLPGATRYLPL